MCPLCIQKYLIFIQQIFVEHLLDVKRSFRGVGQANPRDVLHISHELCMSQEKHIQMYTSSNARVGITLLSASPHTWPSS